MSTSALSPSVITYGLGLAASGFIRILVRIYPMRSAIAEAAPRVSRSGKKKRCERQGYEQNAMISERSERYHDLIKDVAPQRILDP